MRNGSSLVQARTEVGIRTEVPVRGNTSAFLAYKLAPGSTSASVVARFDRFGLIVEVLRDSGFEFERKERLEAVPKVKREHRESQLLLEYRERRCTALRTCKSREGRIDRGCFERLREEAGCG